MGQLLAVHMHEHVVKGELVTRFTLEQIDVNRVALSNSILSAACSDDCVRHGPLEKSRNIHGDRLLTSENPGRPEQRNLIL